MSTFDEREREMNYTASEYTDMIICYGMADENVRAAVRIYAERFPNRRHPTRRTLAECIRRARETGSLLVNRQGVGGVPMRHGVHLEEEIVQTFEENPGSSIRRVARMFGVSPWTVHNIVRRNQLRPFHYQRVQQLLAGDGGPRIHFCEELIAQYRRDDSYLDRILWTDEATFTPNGVFNSRNYIFWDYENPHAIRQGAFQYRWSLNVWAGIIADRVVGPFFLPPRLDAHTYVEFLENELPILLEDVPLNVRQGMIYQHDGAPAHFSRRARNVLDTHFPDRWMGRGGPINWPARSPDLNVLDYFVWGYIKSLVEHRRDGSADEVREEIIAAFNSITPDMAQRATRQIFRRAEFCLQADGWHFEQLLH